MTNATTETATATERTYTLKVPRSRVAEVTDFVADFGNYYASYRIAASGRFILIITDDGARLDEALAEVNAVAKVRICRV